METELVKFFADQKYMWDGKIYPTEKEALENKTLYEKENFETQIVGNGEKFLLYTRRLVTDEN